MQTTVVEHSIWIDAPRARVWGAITDPQQLAQWLVPNLPWAQMERDDSGKISLLMGGMGIDLLTLELNAPLQKATIRSLPDRMLATTYTLEEENNGTRVTVNMSGFESLPDVARQDRVGQSGAGWEKALQNLKAHAEGMELPFKQAFVGPLFGFWREGKKKLAIERSIWINATPERVWRAITDPEQVAQWFAPGTTFKASGSEVGSRLYVENPETGGEMYVQILEVVEPPHRLVNRSVPEPGELSYITEWILSEENSGTRLTLIHSGYEQDTSDARWNSMEQNTFGFGMMLANVKAVVEGKSLPVPGGF